jgi:ATP-dependent helicase YprA (DUF1998 family)
MVVATGAASGKSLVFQAAALKALDRNPNAAVLVFYPLKALVDDQLVRPTGNGNVDYQRLSVGDG